MDEIIEAIRQELKANSDDNTRNNYQTFFKEKVTYYGVKADLPHGSGKSPPARGARRVSNLIIDSEYRDFNAEFPQALSAVKLGTDPGATRGDHLALSRAFRRAIVRDVLLDEALRNRARSTKAPMPMQAPGCVKPSFELNESGSASVPSSATPEPTSNPPMDTSGDRLSGPGQGPPETGPTLRPATILGAAI